VGAFADEERPDPPDPVRVARVGGAVGVLAVLISGKPMPAGAERRLDLERGVDDL